MKNIFYWIVVLISIPLYISLLIVESLFLGIYKTIHLVTAKVGDISDNAEIHIR